MRQLVADQCAECAVLAGLRHRRIQHRGLQHRRGDDQPVVGEVVGQCRLLREHVPAAIGVAAADPAHLLAVPPGRGDQHVPAEAAAAHRLHAVVEVAPGHADLDLQRLQLRARLGLGGIAHPGAGADRADQRVAHLAGDRVRLLAVLRRQVTRGVLAAQHGPGGEVDRVQCLLPARRGHRLPAQHPAAELERRVAPGLGQVRRHGIAHPPAQVSLPLLRLEPADQRVQPREQRRIGDRHGIVAHALRFQEGIELQVAELLAEAGGGDRAEVGARVAQVDQRARCGGDAGFEVDHRGGGGGDILLRHAGQRQDLAYVVVVAAEQGAGVGVAARVVGRIRQAEPALAEIPEVAIEIAQVELRAEPERDRDADLVQRGDRGGRRPSACGSRRSAAAAVPPGSRRRGRSRPRPARSPRSRRAASAHRPAARSSRRPAGRAAAAARAH